MAWRVIRPSERLSPCHMLTAFHDEDYKLTAFGVADGYLEKPLLLVPLEGPYQAILKSWPLVLHLWRGTGGF